MKTEKLTQSNQHLYVIAKIQRLERHVDNLHRDLMDYIVERDYESAKSIVDDICKHNNTIEKLSLLLTQEQLHFHYNNKVTLIEGEGGSDYVSFEPRQ